MPQLLCVEERERRVGVTRLMLHSLAEGKRRWVHIKVKLAHTE